MRWFALSLTASLLLAGCSTASDQASPATSETAPPGQEQAEFPRTVEVPANAGQPATSITIESEPTRIAALTYETGELVAELGAMDRLVLAQESLTNPVLSSHAEEMADVQEHLPTEGNIDAEAVLAADPDLVLLSTRRGLEEGIAKTLAGADIPVLVIPNHWASVEDLTQNIALAGEALGLDEEAAELSETLTAGLTPRGEAGEADEPSVLALSNQAGQPFVVAGSAFPLELLDRAGAHNAGEELGLTRSGPISAEQVLAADPDAILLIDMNGSGDKVFKPLLTNDAVADLPAITSDHVLLVEGRKAQALGFASTIEGLDEISSWLEEVQPRS